MTAGDAPRRFRTLYVLSNTAFSLTSGAAVLAHRFFPDRRRARGRALSGWFNQPSNLIYPFKYPRLLFSGAEMSLVYIQSLSAMLGAQALRRDVGRSVMSRA